MLPPYAILSKNQHGEFVNKRQDWFERYPLSAPGPSYVLWWIDDEVLPIPRQARDRLYLLGDQGDSDLAFSFKRPFPMP